MATIRSIGTRARSAISVGTFTSWTSSRSASLSFGSVIIFMKRQLAASLAATNSVSGSILRSG